MGSEIWNFLWLLLMFQAYLAMTGHRTPVRGPSLRAFRALLPRDLRSGPCLLPAVRCHGTLPHQRSLSAPLVRHGESTRAGPLSVGQVLLHALRFSPYPRRYLGEIMKQAKA